MYNRLKVLYQLQQIDNQLDELEELYINDEELLREAFKKTNGKIKWSPAVQLIGGGGCIDGGACYNSLEAAQFAKDGA